MIKLKKVISGIIAITVSSMVVLSSPSSAFAAKNEKDPTAAQMDSLSDQNFERLVMNYIVQNDRKGRSFSVTQSKLAAADVQVTRRKANSMTIDSLYPSDIDLNVYSLKRGNEGYYHLVSSAVFNDIEHSPGSLDLLSIEWDYTKASYYSTGSGGYTTYMDGSNRARGIVLFNLEDSRIRTAGDYAYAGVCVMPKAGSTDYASKLIHTYNDANVVWNIGGNVGYDVRPNGCLTFGITTNYVANSFQLYADNSVDF